MGKLRVSPNIKSGVGKEKKDIELETQKMKDKSVQGKESNEGSVGTMRVIVDGEKPYLEIKSKQGWVRSDTSSASGFSFKK
tara:strand:+ start:3028 stop:3270 length:243 start_codon:yes stop_codon:yes gene_type:complete